MKGSSPDKTNSIVSWRLPRVFSKSFLFGIFLFCHFFIPIHHCWLLELYLVVVFPQKIVISAQIRVFTNTCEAIEEESTQNLHMCAHYVSCDTGYLLNSSYHCSRINERIAAAVTRAAAAQNDSYINFSKKIQGIFWKSTRGEVIWWPELVLFNKEDAEKLFSS